MTAADGTESPRPDYDDIVVGSSPLMLLQAQKLAAAGRTVCVVERLARLGGVWRTATLGLDDEVEIACHLVEDFPGVYRHLEQASGTPFVELDNQPVRVLGNGRIVRYSSRTTLVLGAVWAFAQLIRHTARRVAGRQTEEESERSHVLARKLADFFRFHLPIVVSGSTIKAPPQGFAAFILGLQERCRESGIAFVQLDVTAIRRLPDGRWVLSSKDGMQLVAEKVHCTASANLVSAGPGQFESVLAHEVTSRSHVLEVPFSAVANKVSYAAFWNDADVVRISRIDQHPARATGLLYLLQLRRGANVDPARLQEVVETAVKRAGLVTRAGMATIVGDVECSYVPHRRQLPDGEIQPGFYGYSSAGNLASGIARWLTRH